MGAVRGSWNRAPYTFPQGNERHSLYEALLLYMAAPGKKHPGWGGRTRAPSTRRRQPLGEMTAQGGSIPACYNKSNSTEESSLLPSNLLSTMGSGNNLVVYFLLFDEYTNVFKDRCANMRFVFKHWVILNYIQ